MYESSSVTMSLPILVIILKKNFLLIQWKMLLWFKFNLLENYFMFLFISFPLCVLFIYFSWSEFFINPYEIFI